LLPESSLKIIDARWTEMGCVIEIELSAVIRPTLGLRAKQIDWIDYPDSFISISDLLQNNHSPPSSVFHPFPCDSAKIHVRSEGLHNAIRSIPRKFRRRSDEQNSRNAIAHRFDDRRVKTSFQDVVWVIQPVW